MADETVRLRRRQFAERCIRLQRLLAKDSEAEMLHSKIAQLDRPLHASSREHMPESHSSVLFARLGSARPGSARLVYGTDGFEYAHARVHPAVLA